MIEAQISWQLSSEMPTLAIATGSAQWFCRSFGAICELVLGDWNWNRVIVKANILTDTKHCAAVDAVGRHQTVDPACAALGLVSPSEGLGGLLLGVQLVHRDWHLRGLLRSLRCRLRPAGLEADAHLP